LWQALCGVEGKFLASVRAGKSADGMPSAIYGCGKGSGMGQVCLVSLVYLISFVQPSKRDRSNRPEKPNKQERSGDYRLAWGGMA
jgi:hypothetical protein